MIEVAVQRKQDAEGQVLPTTSKTIRINKTARRALDLVGHLRVVLFTPLDIELTTGPPSVRRRWLDVMLSQLDGRYVRAPALADERGTVSVPPAVSDPALLLAGAAVALVLGVALGARMRRR